jgi:serine-type D-Ala-D-Ala carboxypeptidase/endopeptidase (penicillin-binding protein 4)
MAVADLETGESLLEINPDKLSVPASTTKLWSSAAALDAFGADYRFVTPVYQRGELGDDGVLEGDLILRAVGDPNLGGRVDANGRLAYTNEMDHTLAEFFDTAEVTPTNPVAGLEDLARQVAARGIRRVRDVLVDNRLFDRQDPFYHEPVRPSAVMINDNIIDLIITPGKAAGEPASVMLSPSTAYVKVQTRVETTAAGQGTQVRVEKLSPTEFVVEGRIEQGRTPLVKIIWIEEPQDFARVLLIKCLEAQGVQVERRKVSPSSQEQLPEEEAYENLPVAARHTSTPFSETLRVVLKVSHNTMADILPVLLASRTGGQGVQAGMRIQGEFIRSIGIDLDAVSLADGSGGSPVNLVTPRAVLQLLQVMAKRTDFPTYQEALPILGVDGTLAHAVRPDSPVRGKVQAKTGTYINGDSLLDGSILMTSKALAGYMTARSGRKLAFAIFLNRVLLPSIPEVMRQGEVLGSVCEAVYEAF